MLDEGSAQSPSVISAAAFRASVRAFKQESVDRQRQARREAELNRRQQIKALLDDHVSAQFWRELLDRAEPARSGPKRPKSTSAGARS
jgi:hypothetical protein